MQEEFEDYLIDAKLNIKTVGRNDNYADKRRYPYEPTDYKVLDKLISSGYINGKDVLFDYGCGYGRVPIYMNYKLGCKGFGIELVKEFYKGAIRNAAKYKKDNELIFMHGKAEETVLPDEVTVCFFFNPFDVGTMRGVLKKIMESYQRRNRRIRLFFYFPQYEYVDFLNEQADVSFVTDIDCTDLFMSNSSRNRIAVFEINII